MIGPNRAVATLVGTAAAAVLLWVAAQFHMHSTSGYWAALGIVAAAGFVLGVLQMRGRTGHPPAMFVAFLPAFVVGAWVLLAMQPHNVWGRHLILSWSHDIHVTGVVRDVGMWVGVIAFGLGYVLGTVLEPAPARRRVVPAAAPMAPAAYDRRAADEPVRAERREVAAREGATTTPTAADGRTTVQR